MNSVVPSGPSLDEIFAQLEASACGGTITTPDTWVQGRTMFGGLTTALCCRAAERTLGELLPLRAAQVAFPGPVHGELRIRSSPIRRGKSTVFMQVQVESPEGLATSAIFAYGKARHDRVRWDESPRAAVEPPDQCPAFADREGAPIFRKNFEVRRAGGGLPVSSSAVPEFLIWLRFKQATNPSAAALLALADAAPSACIASMNEYAAGSTMTWSIEVLDDLHKWNGDWVLIRSRADRWASGFANQEMALWDADGRALLRSRQLVAVYD